MLLKAAAIIASIVTTILGLGNDISITDTNL